MSGDYSKPTESGDENVNVRKKFDRCCVCWFVHPFDTFQVILSLVS